MSLLLTRYASTLSLRYDARDAGNFDLEDSFLDVLDRLWLEMSDEERRACDEVALVTKQRHRMQKNFVSTSFHLSRLRDQVAGHLGSIDSYVICASAINDAREVVRPVRNPLKSFSRSSVPFEQTVAYA